MKRERAEWFIRQVAEGTSGLDANEIYQMANNLAPSLFAYKCFCLVVWLCNEEDLAAHANLPVELWDVCQHAQRQICPEAACYIGNQFRTVMVVSETENNRTALVEKLYRSIEKGFGRPVRIGVGRSYGEINKLNYSRAEAHEALNSNETAGGVFYIDDIYVNRSSTTRKLEAEKRQVIELFKSGRLDQMMNNMVVLAENIRKESPAREGMPYPTSIRRTILEILFEIMHIAADAGVDVEATLNYQDPYNRVFEIHDTPEILLWFQNVAAILYRDISELGSKTETNILTLAKKHIEKHIEDPDLSLTMISGYLGITPSYFSAFFIRKMGVGFQEYITDRRIAQAKELLEKTNYKINVVAEECGFRSASYFINVFRKQTGKSPSEYRNMK